MKSLALAVLMLCTSLAYAQDQKNIIIVPPATDAEAGQKMIFSVFVYNSGAEIIITFLPAILTCHLSTGSRQASIAGHALSADQITRYEIEPKSFIKKQYFCQVPDDLTG